MTPLKLLSGYLVITIPSSVICLWSPMAFASSCCLTISPQRWQLQTVHTSYLRIRWASVSVSDKAAVMVLLEAVDSFHFMDLLLEDGFL